QEAAPGARQPQPESAGRNGALDDLHHTGPDAVSLHERSGAGADLQAHAGRQDRRHARRVGARREAVQLDPRARVPVGERTHRRRHEQLARAEGYAASGARASGNAVALEGARDFSRASGVVSGFSRAPYVVSGFNRGPYVVPGFSRGPYVVSGFNRGPYVVSGFNRGPYVVSGFSRTSRGSA